MAKLPHFGPALSPPEGQLHHLYNFESQPLGDASSQICFNSINWIQRRSHLKQYDQITPFGPAPQTPWGSAPSFVQFWISATWGYFLQNLVKFLSLVPEKMVVDGRTDGRHTQHYSNSSPWSYWPGELKIILNMYCQTIMIFINVYICLSIQ